MATFLPHIVRVIDFTTEGKRNQFVVAGIREYVDFLGDYAVEEKAHRVAQTQSRALGPNMLIEVETVRNGKSKRSYYRYGRTFRPNSYKSFTPAEKAHIQPLPGM